MALINIFAMNLVVLIPILARDILNQTATGYGFLSAAGGIGAITGSVILGSAGGYKPSRAMLLWSAAG